MFFRSVFPAVLVGNRRFITNTNQQFFTNRRFSTNTNQQFFTNRRFSTNRRFITN